MSDSLIQRAQGIDCLICDVDGVMTDGLLYLDNHQNELKAFHVHDGVGIKLLLTAGIEVAVITGAKNAVIDHRMKQLGISHCFKGQHNKSDAFEKIMTTLSLAPKTVAYIGDDIPDIPLMKQVGLSIAVANAVTAVKECAHWQTQALGGRGAVREACEFLLKAQNKYELAVQRYLQQDICNLSDSMLLNQER